MAAPHLISWNLTRRCNLACGHCYLDAVQRKSDAGDEMKLAEIARVIDQIAELAPGAMLVLTGGEPLLRRDLGDIVEHAAGIGLMPVVGSNGLLLDAARARQLRERGAAGVGISLDSTTAEFHDRLRGHDGAWQGALAGMRAAREAGLGVLMQATLFAENRHELAGFADLATEVGAMALNFFFLVCTGRGVTQTDLSGQAYEESLRDILALQQARPQLMIRARCAPYARRMLGLHAGEVAEERHGPPPGPRPAGGGDGGSPLRGSGALAGPAWGGPAPGYTEWSSACLAGRRYLRIGPTGEVTPCPYIPAAAGSVRRQSLREIWETGDAFVRLRQEMPGGKCGACDYRVSCGGCRARALATAGDLMAADDKCAYCPPPSAGPEPLPTRRRESIAWTPEAQRLLDRIPGFVRDKARSSVERQAAAAGEAVVSADFLLRQRPTTLPFRRPNSRV